MVPRKVGHAGWRLKRKDSGPADIGNACIMYPLQTSLLSVLGLSYLCSLKKVNIMGIFALNAAQNAACKARVALPAAARPCVRQVRSVSMRCACFH